MYTLLRLDCRVVGRVVEVRSVVDRVSVEVRVVVVVLPVCAGSERRVDVCVEGLVPASVLLEFSEERDASDGPITRRLVSTPVLC